MHSHACICEHVNNRVHTGCAEGNFVRIYTSSSEKCSRQPRRTRFEHKTERVRFQMHNIPCVAHLAHLAHLAHQNLTITFVLSQSINSNHSGYICTGARGGQRRPGSSRGNVVCKMLLRHGMLTMQKCAWDSCCSALFLV
jgi:hypothetical protein